jgi:hypothetical protein
MNWGITDAKQRFAELIQAAFAQPQRIYQQDQLVAFVVEASLFQEFLHWRSVQKRKTIANAFSQLRETCAQEELTLETPVRSERPNPFFIDNL